MGARHQRPSTPITVPPPEPAAERLAKRVQPWQALVAIALVLVAAGGTAYSFAASKADVTELHQVRDDASSALSVAQAGTSAQLGALQVTVQDLRAHQAAIDASLTALAATTDRLNAATDRLYSQLLEVARATGARQLPAPPPEPQKGRPP